MKDKGSFVTDAVNISLVKVEALISMLLSGAGMRAFTDAAVNVGHERQRAGHMYATLVLELMQHYNKTMLQVMQRTRK